MCKIFALTNMSKVKSIPKTVNAISKALSKYEKDGAGYAIQGEAGVFGERSLDVKGFQYSFDKEVPNLPFVEPMYNRFGTPSKITGPGIFHGRTSTNAVSLLNTHPIIKRDWTLIHNGVVSNHGPKYLMDTTNDTEHLVEYLSTVGISGIEKHLTGYYAVSAISPDGALHVFRDSTAPLHVARIETIDSLVFATKPELIKEVCKSLKWECSLISPMNSDTYLIFAGNQLLSHTSIKPRGNTYSEASLSHLSLGHKTYAPTDYETSISTKYLSDDEESFLDEVNHDADASYTFKDFYGTDLTFEAFQALDDEHKLYCTVIRPDGTLCSPEDYAADKMYQGAI